MVFKAKIEFFKENEIHLHNTPTFSVAYRGSSQDGKIKKIGLADSSLFFGFFYSIKMFLILTIMSLKT